MRADRSFVIWLVLMFADVECDDVYATLVVAGVVGCVMFNAIIVKRERRSCGAECELRGSAVVPVGITDSAMSLWPCNSCEAIRISCSK